MSIKDKRMCDEMIVPGAKAIALFNGGLDATLAMKLIIDQGVEVLAININTGFGSTKNRFKHMQSMCDQVGAEFRVIDIRGEFLNDVLLNPKHGYGKNFNPCIDCHTKMFEVACRIMKREGASFLISGEVLRHRPIGNNKYPPQSAMDDSNCNGLLLRPLCAKKLSPTTAETEGWVDREKLEAISGRGCERQLELAKKYGLKNFENLGGGCLLNDENFSKKMFDIVKYDTFEVNDIALIKTGRHFRISERAKLIVGRDQRENEYLQNIDNDKYCHLKTVGIPGPCAMLSKTASEEDRELAIKIVLTYCKAAPENSYIVTCDGEEVSGSPFPARDDVKVYSLMK